MGGKHEHSFETHLREVEQGRSNGPNEVPQRIVEEVQEIVAMVSRGNLAFNANNPGPVNIEVPVRRGDFEKRHVVDRWEDELGRESECSLPRDSNAQIKLEQKFVFDDDGKKVNDSDLTGLLTARILRQVKDGDVELVFSRDLQQFNNEILKIVGEAMREAERKNWPTLVFGVERRKHPRQSKSPKSG